MLGALTLKFSWEVARGAGSVGRAPRQENCWRRASKAGLASCHHAPGRSWSPARVVQRGVVATAYHRAVGHRLQHFPTNVMLNVLPASRPLLMVSTFASCDFALLAGLRPTPSSSRQRRGAPAGDDAHRHPPGRAGGPGVSCRARVSGSPSRGGHARALSSLARQVAEMTSSGSSRG